jgi:ABC-2 type transport system ATP-binding protein
MSAVVVDGLGKDYRPAASLGELLRGRLRGRQVRALDGVTLELEAGEGLAVLGKNGAGKSTLLQCLAGLVAPTRGRATVFGHDCARGDAALRRAAVFVPADPRTFAWRLSARANLEFFAALHGLAKTDARRRAATVLDEVGLGAVAARRVAELSSGMRQRLAIARAFLGEPQLFLLDEPTAGLDPRAAAEVRALLRARVARGAAVIIATHAADDAAALATRAVLLEEGRVAYTGSATNAWERIHG